MIRHLTLTLVLATAAACGGKQSAPATTTPAQTAESGGPHDGHAMHHEGMPAELTPFHDLLRPRWHAEKGPQRMTHTCTTVPQFAAEADAIAKVTPPTQANADTWTAGTRALAASVANLEATCKANDAAKFDDAFHQVHESFHVLMAAAGMKHEGMGEQAGHGEHSHGDHKM